MVKMFSTVLLFTPLLDIFLFTYILYCDEEKMTNTKHVIIVNSQVKPFFCFLS